MGYKRVPDYVFLMKYHTSYNPLATSPVIAMPNGESWDVDSWMNTLTDDPEIIDLFWEVTSALLRPNVRWNKAVMLVSRTGNNGKGTLLEMWRKLLGIDAYVSIPLSKCNDKYILASLVKALAIITDENDVGSFQEKSANLKAIISNDVIDTDRKYLPHITFRVRGLMVECLNDYPRVKDRTNSFYRRFLFVPMTKCFTGVEIPEIKNDYLHRQDVLEYVMKKALETDFYRLSEPKVCKEALEDYKEFNDPVRQYWNEFKDDFQWNLLPFQFLYDLFVSWFKKNMPSGTVLGKNSFMEDLLDVIKDDNVWYCENKRKRIRVSSKSNMTVPELLILEYDLRDWMNKDYKGANKKVRAIPSDLETFYRGIQRISHDGVSSENNTDEPIDDDPSTSGEPTEIINPPVEVTNNPPSEPISVPSEPPVEPIETPVEPQVAEAKSIEPEQDQQLVSDDEPLGLSYNPPVEESTETELATPENDVSKAPIGLVYSLEAW